MATDVDEALGGLVKKYRDLRGLSQATVAELLSRELDESVAQNIVSENEKGRRWSRKGLPAAYRRILGIPVAEMQAAMGLPDEGDQVAPTFAEIVESDPTLSRAAKDHLINQYGLLQLASQATMKQTKGARRAVAG